MSTPMDGPSMEFVFRDPKAKRKLLPLGVIRTDGGTQMRVRLCQEVYLDYRDQWKSVDEITANSDVLPPVDVFFDGSEYWLADGFHRFYGAKEAGLKEIPAIVSNGTKRQAILFACGANAEHGLRRTNADKRHAVESLLNDPEWVKWSDSLIAIAAAVSIQTVSNVRAQLSKIEGSEAAKSALEPRLGRDGKHRKSPRRPVGTVLNQEVESAPEDEGETLVREFDTSALANPFSRRDANGLEVPECLRDVWDSIETFTRARQSIADALSCFTKLHGGSGVAGSLLRTASRGDNVRDWLKKASGAFKFSTPFCVCPSCGGPGTGCGACGSRGFLTEDQFKQLPDEHKPLLARTGAA